MSPRRMLSKKQCVFVIVVLPVLIIPAIMILKMADKRQEDSLFLPPMPAHAAEGSLRKSSDVQNVPIVKPIKRTKKQKRCSDYIWSGSCHDTCYPYNILAKQRQRKQHILKCEKSKTSLKSQYTTKQKYVFKIPFQDMCLRKIVDWYCQDGKTVPNIVHYVWFGKMEFTFIHFLSFLSVHKIQNPCLIMVHADKMPKGPLWSYFLKISSKVIHVQRKQPKKIFRKKLAFIEHRADIAKIEALKEYGGIYMDTDQVLLKSVDKFRNNDVTMGKEYGEVASNSLIIAKKNAVFLKFWYESYRSYTRTDGNKHSNQIPFKLAKKHKGLVTIVDGLFASPNAHQLSKLYSKSFDWSRQYGMHLHMKLHARFYDDKFNFDTMRTMNTTAGQVARYIIYGNVDMCAKNLKH